MAWEMHSIAQHKLRWAMRTIVRCGRLGGDNMKSLKETLLNGTAGLVFGLSVVSAQADPITTDLFYTTFSGGVNVNKANVTLNGSTLTINTNSGVASLNGADGLLFLPDHNLAVAGQGGFGGPPGSVHEITTAGASVANAPGPNSNGSYHLALNGTGSILYSLCNGDCNGNLTQFNLSGTGGVVNAATGANITVTGGTSQDIRAIVFDPVNNTWYYGTAGDGVTTGTFGTISFSGSSATLTQLLTGVPAHGLTFDPFTNDVIFSSGDQIDQYNPTSNSVVSSVTLAGIGNFDQSAVDGKGHLFVASNGGNLVGLDYDTAVGHLIGGAGATHAVTFLASSLDDIAPLTGPGPRPLPEPASLALLALGLAVLGISRRKLN
jgi:PEP-CTERM motif-containing protein